MVFYPPSWVPEAAQAPDSISLEEFMSNEIYGRQPLHKSRNPFTCGLTGRTATPAQVFLRSDHLSRALSRRTGWAPNDHLTPWDKVVAIFSINTIDYIIPVWATHKLNGIVSPANAAYTAEELEHQLRSSGATVLFTCIPLLDTALKAAEAVGIKRDFIFLLPTVGEDAASVLFPTVEHLITEGGALDSLPPLKWAKGQGTEQVAFITYSSGTSGLPKALLVSHYNVICNVMAHVAFDVVARKRRGFETEVELGLVPMSHMYGLLVVSHTATWRGDEIIVLPKFEFESYLNSIQKYRIERLLVVPPMIVAMLARRELCAMYDLSSVRFVFCGAAPLGEETIDSLAEMYPNWKVGQAYGMTETAVIVSNTSEDDVMMGSAGSLLPGTRAKIVDPVSGEEITSYDTSGELWVQVSSVHPFWQQLKALPELGGTSFPVFNTDRIKSPSVVLGYLDNEQATAETFVHDNDGRWVKTGDKAYITTSPQGNEHVFIVDRIKELIKVKGQQVAPAELEAHLLTHPAVSDVAVTRVPDARAGELPKAFVVRAPEYKGVPDSEVANMVFKHVADHKAPFKWITGGVEFVNSIPKSPSGKVLRRFLRTC